MSKRVRNTPLKGEEMISELYEQDFYAWATKNAELVRQGRLDEVDLEHIAEEIEEMGRNTRRALKRRLEVLLAHLLKWKYQPAFRSKSWRFTIIEQREAIEDLLEESPSLGHVLNEILETAYKRAIKAAAEETELKAGTFPQSCPWSFEQILDGELWPE